MGFTMSWKIPKIKWILFLGVVFLILMCSEEKKDASHAQSKPNQPISTMESESAKPGIKVTFIELGSVKCVPCKMMQPVMEDIEKEYAGQVNVVFHDVWTPQGEPYGQQYGIRSIPTQVFLDSDGKEYYRHVGFFAKEELVKILQMKGVKER